MCGRYALYDTDGFESRYGYEPRSEFRPNYNVSPSQTMPTITSDGLKMMRWGLIPRWAKDAKIGFKLINARSETVFDKPMWKGLIKRQRCLVPMNGFYEWKKTSEGKVPYFIHTNETFMTAAGLWDTWQHEGATTESFSILTTHANADMETIHDRIPYFLHKSEEDSYLFSEDWCTENNVFAPLENGVLIFREVSNRVNSPRNNDESLLVPVGKE